MDDISASRQMNTTISKSGQDCLRLRGHRRVLARWSWGIILTFGLLVALSGFVNPGLFCGQTLCSVVDSSGGILTAVVFILPTIIWIVVGGILFVLKSDDWLVCLISLTLVILGITSLSDNMLFDAHGQIIHGQLPWQIAPYFLYLLKTELSILSLALFPNGQFIPKWTRFVTLVFPIYFLLYFLVPALQRWSIVENPINAVLWWGCEGSLIAAQVYRYARRSRPIEQQQTKLILFSFIVILVADVLNTYFPAFPSVPYLHTVITTLLFYSILIVPISIAVALLRYHLWDVDLIINRTLVYGTLTAILALVYISSIFLFQYLFRAVFHQDNDVAIVISTLLIAALFQPLRRHIQSLIDRRFYRRKYDAATTVEAFSAMLHNEVNLSQLSERMVAVVQETMQPSHVSLWLRPTHPARKHQPTTTNPTSTS